MKPRPGFRALIIRQGGPVRPARLVFARRSPTGPGRNAMQDRPVERRVDDLVVGHVPLLFNAPNLNRSTAPDYVEKPEIVL